MVYSSEYTEWLIPVSLFIMVLFSIQTTVNLLLSTHVFLDFKNIVQWKKLDTMEYIFCDFTYMKSRDNEN